MSNWIPIDHSEFNTRETRDINGVTIDLYMSPYQIPTAVRLNKDKEDFVVIEFKYLDDEPWEREFRDDGIVARTGKHSKRLFGIEISRAILQEHGPNVSLRIVSPRVSQAVDSLRSKVAGSRVGRNYEAAERAISQLDEQLLQESA